LDKKPDDVVSVPRWALEFILRRGCFLDDGPAPEGRPSPEMREALEAIEASTFDHLRILRAYSRGVFENELVAYEDNEQPLTSEEDQELARICDGLRRRAK
jgi:hypothetical protein